MVVPCIFAPAAARAQEGAADTTAADQTARAFFQTGKAHFDVGEWEAALTDFLEAYRLSQRPALLFNIFSCYERMGDAQNAADYLDRYLALGTVPDADRETLTRKLENLKQRAATAATVQKAPAETPAPAAAPAPVVPAAKSKTDEGGLLWTWVAGGAAVASLAAGGVLLGLAAGEYGDLKDKCEVGCTQAEIDDSPGPGLATGATVLFVAGGLLAAGAVTLFFIESDDGSTETRVGLLPGGVSVSGTF